MPELLTGAPTPLVDSGLPDSVLDLALSFCDIAARGVCSCTCTSLRQACARADGQVSVLQITAGSALRRSALACCRRVGNLRALDLAGAADDEVLRGLAGLLPALAALRCAGSLALTDQGLASLAQDRDARAALRHVDITFCSGTTYVATIRLRRALPRLELIRRLPAWLTGRFVTPFGGQSAEAHAYYADGAFDFERAEQSRGYVRFLRHHPRGRFFTNSLQYSNFGEEQGLGWPAWGRFYYRPGVALRPAPPRTVEGRAVRSVLVAQNLTGMRAPSAWVAVPDEVVPLGQSIFVLEGGSLLPGGLQVEAAMREGAVAMVSRMEVQPLESLMPPSALVDEIELFEQQKELYEGPLFQSGQSEAILQDQLHRRLGGQ